LAAGLILKFDSCRGGWAERSRLSSATAIHSVAVDRTPNLPTESRKLSCYIYRRPRLFNEFDFNLRWVLAEQRTWTM